MDASLTNIAFRPPVLDGTNYAIWKVKIRIYIKSLDERAWQLIVNGWSPPTRIDTDGDSRIKPENEWTTDETYINLAFSVHFMVLLL